MTLNWKNPPKDAFNRRRSTKTTDVLNQLQANPGAWALIKEYKDRLAGKVAASSTWRRQAREVGNFEFVVDDKGNLYGRFLGDAEATQAVADSEEEASIG